MVIGGINKEVFVEGVMRKLRNEGEKEQNEGIDNRQELRVKIEDVADSLLKFRLSNEESYNKKNEVAKEKVVEEKEGTRSTSANPKEVAEKHKASTEIKEETHIHDMQIPKTVNIPVSFPITRENIGT